MKTEKFLQRIVMQVLNFLVIFIIMLNLQKEKVK